MRSLRTTVQGLLLISVPLGAFMGVGVAASYGISVKDVPLSMGLGASMLSFLCLSLLWTWVYVGARP